MILGVCYELLRDLIDVNSNEAVERLPLWSIRFQFSGRCKLVRTLRRRVEAVIISWEEWVQQNTLEQQLIEVPIWVLTKCAVLAIASLWISICFLATTWRIDYCKKRWRVWYRWWRNGRKQKERRRVFCVTLLLYRKKEVWTLTEDLDCCGNQIGMTQLLSPFSQEWIVPVQYGHKYSSIWTQEVATSIRNGQMGKTRTVRFEWQMRYWLTPTTRQRW